MKNEKTERIETSKEPKRELTMADIGRLGAKRLQELHPDHMSKIGRRRWEKMTPEERQAQCSKNGKASQAKKTPDERRDAAIRCGEAARDKLGPEHYQMLGAKNAEHMRELGLARKGKKQTPRFHGLLTKAEELRVAESEVEESGIEEQ